MVSRSQDNTAVERLPSKVLRDAGKGIRNAKTPDKALSLLYELVLARGIPTNPNFFDQVETSLNGIYKRNPNFAGLCQQINGWSLRHEEICGLAPDVTALEKSVESARRQKQISDTEGDFLFRLIFTKRASVIENGGISPNSTVHKAVPVLTVLKQTSRNGVLLAVDHIRRLNHEPVSVACPTGSHCASKSSKPTPKSGGRMVGRGSQTGY